MSRALELLALLAVLAGGWFALADVAPRGDESAHLLQILAIHEGDWAPRLTMIPGYHAAMAGLWDLSGLPATMRAGRGISFALSLLGVVAFFLAARGVDRDGALRRTTALAALPALHPYLFLVYTDALALAMLLAATACALHRRMTLAGVFCLLMLCVRQSLAPWAAMLLLLPCGPDEAPRGLADRLRERWALVAVLAAFAGFVAWNRGVALGGRAPHPFPLLRIENVAFAVVVSSILFLPAYALDSKALARRAWRSPWSWTAAAAAAGTWYAFFHVDHPFNSDMYYVHDRILDSIDRVQSPGGVVVAGTWIALGAAALAAWPFARRRFAIVLPFWVISLVPIWLVEHRYAVPGLALLLLFRAPARPRVDWALIGWFALLDAALLTGIRTGTFFP